jgi:hypothetical protein
LQFYRENAYRIYEKKHRSQPICEKKHVRWKSQRIAFSGSKETLNIKDAMKHSPNASMNELMKPMQLFRTYSREFRKDLLSFFGFPFMIFDFFALMLERTVPFSPRLTFPGNPPHAKK